MFKRSWIVAAVVTGLAGAVAWACGPMFPNQLLDDRAATLKSVPQNSFAFEAMHLLPATDKLAAEEPTEYASDGNERKDGAAQSKALGLSIAQLGRVKALSALDDGDMAYAQGGDLPEDLRAYIAGAVDFAQGRQDKALARFEQVLSLPPDHATLRGIWAAYMLGRIHAANAAGAGSDATVFARERAAAAKAFQLVRTRALAGVLDPQGLAVSSFGEEARLYLYSHGTQCSWSDLYGVTDADEGESGGSAPPSVNAACGDGIAAADLKRAITLYAAQAGHASNVGVQSLVAIADYAMRSPQRTSELIDSPLPQRLLVAYALARMGGSSAETPEGSAAKPEQSLRALVQAIEQRGLGHLEGADRLAALAYQTGRYDLAAKLVEQSSGPLSQWVRAKLALQKGDLAAASAAYAAAAKAFPKQGEGQPAIEPSNTQLIIGEQGVLALARGEYVEAMGHLYDAAQAVGGDGNVYDWDSETSSYGYGNDAMYIAERVLTVDELKTFVDARAPATPVLPQRPGNVDNFSYRAPIGDSLRWLLARRLMRSARYEEALAYFPADNDARFGSYDDDGKRQLQSFRTPARDYAKALHDSEHAWTDIGKAQALYAAAVIAREHGMEILGYEQGPDYTDSEGSFQGGSGQTPQSMTQTYVTEGERQRYAASQAKPNYRFHYRYLAADQASQAADRLPPRSQAFAAVLCQATSWMMDGPPDYDDHYQGWGEPAPTEPSERQRRITAYYQRYVKQGAYVEWAGGFGTACEQPDFDRARALKRSEQMAAVKHAMRRHWPLELGALVLVLGGLAAWIVRRRRRRALL